MPRGQYKRKPVRWPLASTLWKHSLVEHHSSTLGPCWVWHGAIVNGYGRMTISNKNWRVHRAAWEFFVGPIPEGLDLDHLCRVRACWRPEHLEPVTRSTNLLRRPKEAA